MNVFWAARVVCVCTYVGRVTRLGEFSPMYWAIVYFGQCFENYGSNVNFLPTFLRGISCPFILTNHCLGHILGDFFTNSYGRPACRLPFLWRQIFRGFDLGCSMQMPGWKPCLQNSLAECILSAPTEPFYRWLQKQFFICGDILTGKITYALLADWGTGLLHK
jgi:hypothetical protein